MTARSENIFPRIADGSRGGKRLLGLDVPFAHVRIIQFTTLERQEDVVGYAIVISISDWASSIIFWFLSLFELLLDWNGQLRGGP